MRNLFFAELLLYRRYVGMLMFYSHHAHGCCEMAAWVSGDSRCQRECRNMWNDVTGGSKMV